MPARARSNLDPALGHEQAKTRPCVVIQNNVGNKYSPVTIVAVITGAGNVPKASSGNNCATLAGPLPSVAALHRVSEPPEGAV
jgi:mRNA-degrading endonuclease toxin of MazEF toxin-antitoxin module